MLSREPKYNGIYMFARFAPNNHSKHKNEVAKFFITCVSKIQE